MNPPLTGDAFRRLLDNLRAPVVPAPAEPYWPYPWDEEEMMARYGLRPLTAEEQMAFPGVRLALRVFRARLLRPPAAVPAARAGWVVWVAETYPGCYLARIPGGGTLPVPYNEMTWQIASDATRVTTLADAQTEERRRQWQQILRHRLRQSLLLPDAD